MPVGPDLWPTGIFPVEFREVGSSVAGRNFGTYGIFPVRPAGLTPLIYVSKRSGQHVRWAHRLEVYVPTLPSIYFTPAANTVWKCGLCFSRETTRTSMFLNPAFSRNWCNCTSLNPSQ